MNLRNDQELLNTQRKLARLEERYAALASQTGGNQKIRELTMESLRGTINQFKEEITRYQACGPTPQNGGKPRELRSEQEVQNTRAKLRLLEERCESLKNDDEDDFKRASRRSLKRLVNQLKEEIAWYEAHQTA